MLSDCDGVAVVFVGEAEGDELVRVGVGVGDTDVRDGDGEAVGLGVVSATGGNASTGLPSNAMVM